MTFRGACLISLLAHRQQVFQAPFLLAWIVIVHYIFEMIIAPITILLIGAIIIVYQQFSAYLEDTADGFFEYCRYNGLHFLSYAWAKSIGIWVGTIVPMSLVLLILGINIIQLFLIASQWIMLSICISCILISISSNPLKLLLGWLPLLTAPLVFLMDFMLNQDRNSLLILLGCDIILISSICVPFTFRKS